MTVNCPTCNKECKTENGMKNHHAKVHDVSLAKATYSCANCGSIEETWQSQVNSGYGNNKRYCSMNCRGEAQSNIRDREWIRERMTDEQWEKNIEINHEEAKKKLAQGKLGPQAWKSRGQS